MFIDTHCHLNFKKISENEVLNDEQVKEIIDRARKANVGKIIVPGTRLESSKRAVELSEKYNEVYAAVGIHAHHAKKFKILNLKFEIANLLSNKKTVAIGEVGIDKHLYQISEYENYQVDEEFLEKQKELFKLQIELAKEHNKALIVHNREAVEETLSVLSDCWDSKLSKKTVFHCCEVDERLLSYSLEKKIFIGVDGDISWSKKKQRFIKEVPLELLVLETDAPFLTPLSLKEKEKFNEPKNIPLIAKLVAEVKGVKLERVEKQTTENAAVLFNLP